MNEAFVVSFWVFSSTSSFFFCSFFFSCFAIFKETGCSVVIDSANKLTIEFVKGR